MPREATGKRIRKLPIDAQALKSLRAVYAAEEHK